VWKTANDNPTPGGGSVAAVAGALGAALATMVANLSAHKRGWDHRWEEFSRYAERGKEIGVALLKCVDRDAEAFNRVMAAYKMPKSTEAEKFRKQEALQTAVRMAIEVPSEVMLRAHEVIELAAVMAREGIPQSVTDAAVGAICARAAIEGALLNVKVNAAGCSDRSFSEKTLAEGEALAASARKAEAKILKMVNEKIGC
jgi:glutamate formiminotransferase/formiminotetrahydrofolate cyclodeaminase